MADVNGDGIPDVVLGSYSSSNVTVLLGNGNGTFQNPATFAANSRSLSVAVADVNGDGKPDLLVGGLGSGSLGILLGNGNGTFQNQINFAVGQSIGNVAVADVNGDGRPDLVITEPKGGNVNVLLNSTNGNFAGQIYTISPAAAAQFAITAPASVTAGMPFAITVTAENSSGAALPSYAGTIQFSSGDSKAVLPANATLTNGVGVFSVTLKTAGNQELVATDTVQAAIAGTSIAITVGAAAAATHFAVTAPATSGPGVPCIFTVTALDQFGNKATSYSGTVHFSSQDPNAILPADSALTGGAGVFTATFMTAGNQGLTAAATGALFQPLAPASTISNNDEGLVTADFNGDGKADVATASGSTISVLLEMVTALSQTQHSPRMQLF